MKKLLPAGKLKNLNDLVIGASVLTAGGLVGHVYGTDKKIGKAGSEDIVQLQVDIKYPMSGTSYHSYRHDGRSIYDAERDIVTICRPENSKIKSIKVWSDQPLDAELLEAGNNLGLVCKLYIDTNKKGKDWKGNSKPTELNGFAGVCKLGKSGMLSVKVWRV